MIRFANYPAVNTGALVAVRRQGLTIHLNIVAVSAVHHLEPHYALSREAPRIYGNFNEGDIRRAWAVWTAEVVAGACGDTEMILSEPTESAARRYVEDHLASIPED